jgi:hypothetical protein
MPIQTRIWIGIKNADPHKIPIQGSIFFTFFTAIPVYNVFLFSSVAKVFWTAY